MSDKEVTGPKFRLESTELAELLRKRAAYHAERADLKEKEQLPKLEAAAAVLDDNARSNAFGKGTSSYVNHGELPVDSLKDEIRAHRSKAFTFGFLADHLIPCTYLLDVADLARFELVRAL